MSTPEHDAADLATFTRQLGAMLDAGVDVLRALRVASQHVGTERILSAADDIARRMKDGREFHHALARHPSLFDPFYVEMARQGEADGILGRALLAVADYLDRSSGVYSAGDAAPAVAPAGGGPVAAVTLAACGAGALGIAAVWSLAGSGKIANKWLGPLSALWTGACLAGGAWALREGGETRSAPEAKPVLPPKTVARRAAETEGIVRNALHDQEEEGRPGPSPAAPRGDAHDLSEVDFGAGGPVRGELEPDPNLPRFEL